MLKLAVLLLVAIPSFADVITGGFIDLQGFDVELQSANFDVFGFFDTEDLDAASNAAA
jgi:hypothetical protein